MWYLDISGTMKLRNEGEEEMSRTMKLSMHEKVARSIARGRFGVRGDGWRFRIVDYVARAMSGAPRDIGAPCYVSEDAALADLENQIACVVAGEYDDMHLEVK